MIFTDHELNELARFAQSAYANGHNAIGHKFSALAATAKGRTFTCAEFDAAMKPYRAWLVFNEF